MSLPSRKEVSRVSLNNMTNEGSVSGVYPNAALMEIEDHEREVCGR